MTLGFLPLFPVREERAGERRAVFRSFPLSSILSPLVPRGERKKRGEGMDSWVKRELRPPGRLVVPDKAKEESGHGYDEKKEEHNLGSTVVYRDHSSVCQRRSITAFAGLFSRRTMPLADLRFATRRRGL